MKKLTTLTFAALFAVGTMLFTACTKKETVETNNSGMSDSDAIADGNLDIIYTVNVVSAANATTGKTAASVAGAKVTIAQGEVTKEYTVKDDGNATFNLKPGVVAGTVTLANHTTVHFTANLRNGTAGDHVDASQTRMASSIITLWSTNDGTATIKGRLRYEDNLTNNTPVVTLSNATNRKVTATLGSTFAYPNMNAGTAGEIVSVSIEGTTISATTDSNGEYTLTVPASSKGVPMTIMYEQFTASQVLSATVTDSRKLFTLGNNNITVTTGQTYINDRDY